MARAPKKQPKKTGRPTKRTDAVIDAVIAGVSEGTPLTIVCRDNGITARVFYDWMEADAELSSRFAHARDLGFDCIAAEIFEIADDGFRDTTLKGGLNKEWVERSKLRVHARLQLLAKWDPKRYGDKMQHVGDGGGAIKLNVSSEDASL